jgi:homocysteine S-methyltransferase
VEIIFCETFIDFEEMEIALQARQEVAPGLTICSFACPPGGLLASGMTLADAFASLLHGNAQIVGLNCTNGPHSALPLLQETEGDYFLSAYPNAGDPESDEGRLVYRSTPDDFGRAACEMMAKGVRLIGGCCGTNAKHIAAIAEAISRTARRGDS